jgi:hypothetical protein
VIAGFINLYAKYETHMVEYSSHLVVDSMKYQQIDNDVTDLKGDVGELSSQNRDLIEKIHKLENLLVTIKNECNGNDNNPRDRQMRALNEGKPVIIEQTK